MGGLWTRRRIFVLAGCLIAIGLLTVTGIAASADYRIGFLYLGPLVIAAWWLDRRLALSCAATASVGLVAGDVTRGTELPLDALLWNEFTRVTTLLATTAFVSSLRGSRDRLEAERDAMVELTVTDPLTGLYNRRFLEEQMRILHSGAARRRGSFSVPARPQPSTTVPAAVTTPPPSVAGSPRPTAARPAYLDDRSTADQLLRSYYNAVNRREFARAYSYWQDPSSLGPYERFAEGYARTESIDLAIIGSTSDVGAGQLYWTLATRLAARQSDGTMQYFAICYRLHLSRPEIQSPPYHGIELIGAETRPAANAGEATRLLLGLCPSTDDRPTAAP